jgi:hypothetical protein
LFDKGGNNSFDAQEKNAKSIKKLTWAISKNGAHTQKMLARIQKWPIF